MENLANYIPLTYPDYHLKVTRCWTSGGVREVTKRTGWEPDPTNEWTWEINKGTCFAGSPLLQCLAGQRAVASQVVQSLTMFKALLDWTRPTDNNVQLSSKFKRVLQRIIDTVFDSLGPLHGAHFAIVVQLVNSTN